MPTIQTNKDKAVQVGGEEAGHNLRRCPFCGYKKLAHHGGIWIHIITDHQDDLPHPDADCFCGRKAIVAPNRHYRTCPVFQEVVALHQLAGQILVMETAQ